MKFIHTSDWHIGLKPKVAAEAGAELAAARFRAVKKIRDLANSEQVDFTLVAGDMFDSHGIGTHPIQELKAILEGFSQPIYVIPGNHDHWTVEGFWGLVKQCWPANVHVLSESEPVNVKGGMLFPCPLLQKMTPSDPLAWIPKRQGKEIRISLAYGSVVGAAIGTSVNAISPKAYERADLNYLALGDTHSFQTYESDGMVRMWSCPQN